MDSRKGRSGAFLVALLVLAALLWQPVVRPAGRAAIAILSIYSQVFAGRDLAALVTPEPRVSETREQLAGESVRVSWWRPGVGDRHPGVLLVNGATAAGNDDPETRRLAAALARAGYLVALPELRFLTEGRLDPAAPRSVAEAFALLRAREETVRETVGAFGFSVGGGMLLAAAGREPALRDAGYLAVLGAYFDVDTYLASVVSGMQQRGTALVPWEASEEARTGLPRAALAAASTDVERGAIREALRPGTYDEVLARIRALPGPVREVLERVSARPAWGAVGQAVFWLHDENDRYEPIAEAEAAALAPREGRTTLAVTRLVSHAMPAGGEAQARGPLFIAAELAGLCGFAMAVLRASG